MMDFGVASVAFRSVWMAAYLEPIGEGRRIVLDKAVVFIGRAADCDVVLTRSRKVSRKHCCFAQVGDSYVLRDLGSMNGVRVNGKRVRNEVRLAFGDEVTIGDLRYILRSIDDGQLTSNNNFASKANPSGNQRAGAAGKGPAAPASEYTIAPPEPEVPFPLEPKSPGSLPMVDSGDDAWKKNRRADRRDEGPDADWQLDSESD
jgi:predicted component of type VI protein secretion system